MAKILSGKEASQALLSKLNQDLQQQFPNRSRDPGLAIIQVGNDPASTSYIRQKQKLATSCAVNFEHQKLSEDCALEDIKSTIEKLKSSGYIDGILIQLPLDHKILNRPEITSQIIDWIGPDFDADGLHTSNQGKLFTGESSPQNWTSPLPCTALGILRLLEHNGINTQGANACVIGRSRLVGLPTAALLTHSSATVTVCHSRTKDLKQFTQIADIIIVAVGSKHLLQAKHLATHNCILVDVGIHAEASDGPKRKLTGDIHPDALNLAAAYSPVPGGVGPMTVCCLIENTVRLFMKHHNSPANA